MKQNKKRQQLFHLAAKVSVEFSKTKKRKGNIFYKILTLLLVIFEHCTKHFSQFSLICIARRYKEMAVSLSSPPRLDLLTEHENSVHFRMSDYRAVCDNSVLYNADAATEGHLVPISGKITKCLEFVNRLMSAPECDSGDFRDCLLYTSPSPRDRQKSRMPSSA